jgi:hypothetical protein
MQRTVAQRRLVEDRLCDGLADRAITARLARSHAQPVHDAVHTVHTADTLVSAPLDDDAVDFTFEYE